MIIDSHEHVILPTDEQIRQMDRAGIDKTVLFTTTPHPEKARNLAEFENEFQVLNTILCGENSTEERLKTIQRTIDELCGVIKAHPSRFYGFGAVPSGLSYDETGEWIERHIQANELMGIGELSPVKHTVKQMDPLFRAASDHGNLPLWIHTLHPATRENILEIATLCGKYPSLPVIFGHMGGANWLDAIHLAREYHNIYLDISATYTTYAVRYAMLELPERTLFSSDAPYGSPSLSRSLVEEFSSGGEVTERVLGGNIQDLLRV